MLTLKMFASLLVLGLVLPATRATASPSEMLAAGRVDEVIASLQAQLAKTPADAASYNYLCRAYYSVRDWDRAIPACEKAVSLAGGNSDYHLWLGRAYGEKAENSTPLSAMSLARKVRKQLEKAVEFDPSNIEARIDLAEFYLQAPGFLGGGEDKARSEASALTRIARAKAHYVLGRLAEKNKQLTTAEREYRAAIEDSAGNAHDWVNLALFYRHQNRLREMEHALDTAVNAPAAHNEVMIECADMLVRTGQNPVAAARLVRRYLAADQPTEDSPLFEAHYVLGSALEKQGDRQGAAHEYRAALALASNFPAAREGLGRVNR
ncbi:MAG: tetratricopeptide repeat protein [Acidobacteria bacterium]|nr:tetratricopeptide repeat protein [Acidobacteriota bacterium]